MNIQSTRYSALGNIISDAKNLILTGELSASVKYYEYFYHTLQSSRVLAAHRDAKWRDKKNLARLFKTPKIACQLYYAYRFLKAIPSQDIYAKTPAENLGNIKLIYDQATIKDFTQEKMFSVLEDIEKDIQHLRVGKTTLKDGLVKNRSLRDIVVHTPIEQ